MQQKADEKIDPLTRIQEEIKEVVRREEEYRQLVTLSSSGGTPPIKVEAFEASFGQQAEAEQGEGEGEGVLVTAQPAAVTALLGVPLLEGGESPSNTPSLASSVNSGHGKEESLDEHHSDDSGISASSQKTKNNSNSNNNSNNGAGKQTLKLNIGSRQEQRYIGPNCYNMTPEPPQQKLMPMTMTMPMTRTISISTPQLNGQNGQSGQKRQFAFNNATKGVMQRFIASHGKLQLGSVTPTLTPTLSSSNNNSNMNQSPTLKLNSRNAMAFMEAGTPASPLTLNLVNSSNNNMNNMNNLNNNNTLSQGAIERDSEGRPLRRGYVPVEQKIQRELQDLKSRETELKRLRKLNRQHMLDKLQLSTDDEADADDDDDDSEVEHCYGPGKLRNAQSTLELDRESNDLEMMGHKSSGNRSLNAVAVLATTNSNSNSNCGSSSGMRPAMSLAELCDLTPEEAPSSHRLIAQWESLIKKNAVEGIEAAI
ncbi:hypothetical protein ACLKA6_003155 [Drosophila palustris]